MKNVLILTILFGSLGMQSLFSMQEAQETALGDKERRMIEVVQDMLKKNYDITFKSPFNELYGVDNNLNLIDGFLERGCGKSFNQLAIDGTYNNKQRPNCAEWIKIILGEVVRENGND